MFFLEHAYSLRPPRFKDICSNIFLKFPLKALRYDTYIAVLIWMNGWMMNYKNRCEHLVMQLQWTLAFFLIDLLLSVVIDKYIPDYENHVIDSEVHYNWYRQHTHIDTGRLLLNIFSNTYMCQTFHFCWLRMVYTVNGRSGSTDHAISIWTIVQSMHIATRVWLIHWWTLNLQYGRLCHGLHAKSGHRILEHITMVVVNDWKVAIP